uniref:Nucleoprotein TPR n=1 Tax=Astatotilapia calliptera TaxID=8154 RepID=A0AAX7UQK8_ASTCA
MAVVLLQALERTELNKLPKGIQNKLEKFVTELQNANEVLQTQHERFKADSEQQYFDMEKRLAESQEQILSATKDLQTLKEENKKLSKSSYAYQPVSLFYMLSISAQNLIVQSTLKKKNTLIGNLLTLLFVVCGFVFAEDVKRLNEKLTDSNKVKMELQLKLDEIQSSAASVQHREKRMEQEKELLEKKIEWLTAELKTKTEELLNTNREKGEEILELQSSLKSSEQKVKDEKSAMEEKYRNELNAHVKLSSLYKGAATDMETKTQELSRAVEELSKLVKETLEANKALEKKVSEGEELKTRLEEELKEKVKKMEKELENATVKAAGMPSMTEEQLDAMCPSAASIAAIVKPGMKFFDLYNAYAECQTQLQLEKQETRRVSRVLDEIVQEVESKAPVLKQQREEYESMQRSMASLCNKLEQARTEIYSLQKEKEEVKQHCDTLEREKLRIERLLEDTSAQVCGLLVELEEARGNHVTKDDGSSADISRTSEVISPHQLSFRSVEELQRHNQSLLGRLRELEEEKDKQQSQVTSARISELESSVDRLHKEVEQLREQRNQQKQLADSNARQRDMYKALLTQSTGFSLPPQGDKKILRPVCSIFVGEYTHIRNRILEALLMSVCSQLNDAFALYKKEKAENDRILNETNDRLQRQLTELRSSHAKLTSQLEFSNKRYEILQEAVSAYRREIVILQERNQKMSVTAQRHEHIIHTMSQDLRQANEKIALEEVRVENLTKERDMLRQAESRLSREKEAMLAEQRNQNLLLTNLKTIQLTMERAETETRQHLNNKIEQLESELASMKTRLEQEVAQRHALGRTMDAQLLEAKKQLETQNTLQQKTRELLRSSEQQVAALKAQLASATSSEATTTSSTTTTPVTRAVGLRAPVEEKKSELEEQLKSANASVEQYRSVVLTLEDSLEKEKELRSPLEVRLKESEEVQKQLEKKILELEKMKQQEQEERRKAVGAVEKQVSYNLTCASRVEQQEALERAAAAVTLEQKAVQDSLLQTKLAGEAQAKYERELMLHAADVEALQELKKKFQQGAAQKMELEEELKKTTSLLQEKTAAWSTAEKKLKDLSNQSRHCEELGKQNSLLHEQMDEIAAKSRQLQQQQQQQQPQQLDLSFSEEGKTTEQILEILRFVRREKDIAIAQCEASDGEALRYKQQVEHQERELKELQETLNAEREKMQATAKTLVQQEEQLKKMETISALRETNKMLKMDRDKLEQELQQAQAKITKLQSDISPLHHSLSVLSEKNGSLQADKRLLEEDFKRLKAKNQQLISQQKDGDVEERQKLTTEREAQQKRITQLAEETAKLKAELARSSASGNSAQSQLHGLRESVARLTSERDSLKKDLETKNNDIVEKNKTITQVKKIGRRYKTQYEELKAQHDKMLFFFFYECFQEKTKKAFLGAKTKINQLNKQLSQEVEELKQSKEELEVRMNALKSQYEGRLLRLDRELRERRETQTHSDTREETQDQSGNTPVYQRQISLKSPAQDRGSSTLSEPPTANIRPTPSTPSPSNKPSPSPGSKATPRASIRPLVTLATVPVPTPMATVMPTTQTESQEDISFHACFSQNRNLTHSSLPGEGSGDAPSESNHPRDPLHLPPTSAPSPSSSSLTPRMPHTRRPPHPLPPRLYIQPPAPELGPPQTQRQASQLRRPSSGRGPQLTPGIGSMQPFFDDDDRMVPSTPTLVVPHRTDGFAEAIHSPQVAGLSTRFRFGPPEDLLPQTSASHSDLGQLASQGGLGMYESPLFLAAHDEDGGGRSVPTTPLQVAAPVTVFTESLPSDSSDNMASQSVPMVTASTGMAAATDDGDEVFMEQEVEGPGIESTLESQTDMESAGQQSDDASLPSTSQDPGNVFFLLTDRCQSNHILCKVVIKVKTVLN